ncbi:MAG TPA: fused MFS/spermidine synthase, partial [Vicinamibacteria bacterium]|nr:fused MFS/spermidine synthase [Vicinamibacteria bacterium]
AAEPALAAGPAAVPRFRPDLLLVTLAFLVSGAAGLVYQVAWQRILALHSGVGIYSIAMIVGAFMAGLGVGSHLGGAWSQRLDRARALRLFAAVEIGIGLFGAVSCWLYYDLLYLQGAWLYTPAWRAGLLHFAGLFVPTFLMGTSLPFLVRSMVLDAGTASRTIGLLYGVNILGAAIGSVLTPWLLIRHYGIRGAVTAAAVANLAAGLLALAAGALASRRPPSTVPAGVDGASGGHSLSRHPFPLWVALYALSGCVALSLEVLWFRVLEMSVKSTAFTFGTLLGYYLLGNAIGCFLGVLTVHRVGRPLRLFLLLQCGVVAWACATMAVLGHARVHWPVYRWYMAYWGKGWFFLGSAWEPDRFFHLYVLLPLFLFLVPTILMGLSFPTLQRAVHDDVRTTGRKVGLLQAANIAGCVAGSLLVGLLAVDLFGSMGTFRLIAAIGVAFAVLGIVLEGRVFAAAAALLVLLGLAVPSQRQLWLRLHGSDASSSAIMEEDASGVGALIEHRPNNWAVFVHGKSHSWIPFGGIHTRLGAAPAMIHTSPTDIAIIGLGSGDTAWASAARPETKSLTVFEISGPQPRILSTLAQQRPVAGLRQLLNDPRLRIREADGRNALEQEGRYYDVIEADALWPQAPYSGNLYSVEFFQQAVRRLKPGGIICTWAPTPRVYHSLAQAAPYMVGVGDRSILFASNQPIPFEPETWKGRAASPEVRAYLGEDAAKGVILLLETIQPLNVRRRQHRFKDMNWDLFPRDEFSTP